MAGLDGALVGAGNPLLDLSAVVDQPLLDKYGVSGDPLDRFAMGDERTVTCRSACLPHARLPLMPSRFRPVCLVRSWSWATR